MNSKSKYNTDEYLNKWYNNLFVFKYLASNADENIYKEPAYLCKCKCGEQTIKRVKHVINGVATACDKCNNITKNKSKYNDEDIISKKYGRLTIVEFLTGSDNRNEQKAPAYVCKCDCGNIVIKKASHVINHKIKSCGKCRTGRSKYADTSYIGKKYGSLEIIGLGHDGVQSTFMCRCDCGRSKVFEYSASMIANGYKQQCSICASEISLNTLHTKRYNNSLLQSLLGTRHGKLVIKSIYKDSKGYTYARCDCDCGTKNHDVLLSNLYRDTYGTKACGNCRIAPNEKYGDNEYIGQTINNLTILDIKKESSKTYWLCRCELCEEHNVIWLPAHGVASGNNKSCGCMQSNGESVIEKALKSKNINYKKQVTFKDLKGIRGGTLRFDFGIYDNRNNLLGLIEYDGEQHFKDYNDNYYITEYELVNNVNIVKENDKIKNQYCIDNNIQLVRLSGYITEDIFFDKMKEACKN